MGGSSMKNYMIYLDPVDIPAFYLKDLLSLEEKVEIEELVGTLSCFIEEELRKKYPRYNIDVPKEGLSADKIKILSRMSKIVKIEFASENLINKVKIFICKIIGREKVVILKKNNSRFGLESVL